MCVYPRLAGVSLRAGLLVLTTACSFNQEKRPMPSHTIWSGALAAFEAATTAPEQARKALLVAVLPPFWSFGEKIADGHIASTTALALEALAGRGHAPSAAALERLVEATDGLKSVPSSGRALRAFAERCPGHISPKTYFHAVSALACKIAKVPVPTLANGKTVLASTKGGEAAFAEFVSAGKITQAGLNALLCVVDVIVESSDASLPDVFGSVGGRKASVGAADVLDVDAFGPKKQSAREALLQRLGRAPSPSPAAATAAGTKAAGAVHITAVRTEDGDEAVSSLREAGELIADLREAGDRFALIGPAGALKGEAREAAIAAALAALAAAEAEEADDGFGD